jgi:ribosomal protein S18 acetylase RimI-like enzyme
MELHYQQLSPAQVEPVHEILRLCGLDMQERLGLSHWVPPYPLEKLRQDAENRQVYAVLHENQVIATFTLGTALPRSYEKIPAILQMWNTPQPRALYINHLAILPSLQGRGLGRRCTQMIESMAAEQGCEVMRLDAYSKHTGLQIFYSKLGFRNIGHFVFWSERRGEAETTCYEKLLVPLISVD